jgi:hypothetical protein
MQGGVTVLDTAHKLLRVIFAMLTRGELMIVDCNPQYQIFENNICF